MNEPVKHYPYQILNHYPGLTLKDKAVWQTFIPLHPNFCTGTAYNIRVGEGLKIEEDLPGKLNQMTTKISQLRIDVICFTKRTSRIVELKPLGSCTSIGQLTTYQYFYGKQFKPKHPITPTLICYYCPPDIKTIAAHLGFEIIEVPCPDGFYR